MEELSPIQKERGESFPSAERETRMTQSEAKIEDMDIMDDAKNPLSAFNAGSRSSRSVRSRRLKECLGNAR